MTLMLCLLLFSSFFLHLDSQELNGRKNYIDDEGLRQGYWERKYPNGNIRYHGTFKNDRPVGELIRYFPGGSKMAIMFFCNDGIRAETQLFYEDGNLAARGIYIDEKKDSLWEYFSFYDNYLARKETYDMGKKEGVSTAYYPDGQVAESFWYENDLKNGPWRQYYQNGNLRIEAEFINDQQHGSFVYYSSTGRVEIKGYYKNNLRHGEWIFYDESGHEVSVINFIEGIPENEEELIEQQQKMFREIEQMRGKIPEPDESDFFSPDRR